MATTDPTILAGLTVDVATYYGYTIDPATLTVNVDMRSPIMDRIEAVTGRPRVKNQQAAVYSLLTAADFESGGEAAFAAGEDPYSIEPTRAVYSVAKKSYGASGGIKDIDIISSTMPGAPISLDADRFRDDAALLLELLYMKTRRGIDRDTVTGDSGTTSAQFDGIETLITSSTVDSSFYLDAASGAFAVDMLNEVIVAMMAKKIYPTAIYCNPIIHLAINQAYQQRNGVSLNMSDSQEGATAGLWITQIVTPAGRMPVVSDPFFTIAGSAPTFTGDIFIVTERFEGVNLLYYEWQVMPTAIPLSKVMGRGRATTTELAVWSHLCLVERTQGYAHGIIENVAYTANQTWSNPSE